MESVIGIDSEPDEARKILIELGVQELPEISFFFWMCCVWMYVCGGVVCVNGFLDLSKILGEEEEISQYPYTPNKL